MLQIFFYEVRNMQRPDSSPERTAHHGPEADSDRSLLGSWLRSFFPIWADMPPYDRASSLSGRVSPGSAVKR